MENEALMGGGDDHQYFIGPLRDFSIALFASGITFAALVKGYLMLSSIMVGTYMEFGGPLPLFTMWAIQLCNWLAWNYMPTVLLLSILTAIAFALSRRNRDARRYVIRAVCWATLASALTLCGGLVLPMF